MRVSQRVQVVKGFVLSFYFIKMLYIHMLININLSMSRHSLCIVPPAQDQQSQRHDGPPVPTPIAATKDRLSSVNVVITGPEQTHSLSLSLSFSAFFYLSLSFPLFIFIYICLYVTYVMYIYLHKFAHIYICIYIYCFLLQIYIYICIYMYISFIYVFCIVTFMFKKSSAYM